jgi:predicted dehydrogenase
MPRFSSLAEPQLGEVYMQPVKLAIVGCGRITEDSHLPAALKSPAIELSALVDGNLERAQRLARMYGSSCALATELEPVLTSVDCVLIATPNHTHFPLASAALERGLPVLVEKPLTVTFAESRRLCETARSMGTFVSVGFHTRHYPVVPLMKRLLQKGSLGRVRSFHFEYGTRGGWAPHSGYILRREQSGGGVLVVNGTHFIDRMILWFGMPTSFRYSDDSYGGVEANCQAMLEFPDGFTGSLRFSKTIDLGNHFEMETDLYRVQISSSEQKHIKLWAHDAPDIELAFRDALRPAPEDCFQVQLEEFARAVRGHGLPSVDGEAGMLSVKLCEELYARREQLAEPWVWKSMKRERA